MDIERPEWKLRGLCPVCGQGSSLTLVSCPQCLHLAVVCEEEGSGFADPKAVKAELAVDAVLSRCPTCRGPALADFDIASADQILEAGMQPSEYK